jgi:hypothetical protein
LIGAYTGEVIIRVYGGEWVRPGETQLSFAVSVSSITAFPFGVAARVLRGEQFKSLASFGRALPAVVEQSRRTHVP